MSEQFTLETNERLLVPNIRKTIELMLEEVQKGISSEKVLGQGNRSLDSDVPESVMEHIAFKVLTAKMREILSISDSEMERLVTLLRKLRGALAYQKQVKPYVIFPDSALIDLLIRRPKTLEELGNIPQFPADGNRVEKWGPAIIAIFQDKQIEGFLITDNEAGEPSVTPVMKRMSTF